MNDDFDFNTAWREFARDDANAAAPARLRPAVMAAWDAAQLAQRDRDDARGSRRWRMSVIGMLAAAAALIVVVGMTAYEKYLWSYRGGSRGPVRYEMGSGAMAPVGGAIAQVTYAPVDAFPLIADPTFEAESFEIVRVRIPRTSLEAMGVALIGPEVTSLVDVDVIVGGDGLPRAIRGITPVVGIQ
jgi:hypothetical protein